jgi:hypothetical protein
VSEAKVIESAEDVTPAVLAVAEDVYDSWFADYARIDWEAFIDRLDKYGLASEPPFEFESYWSPAVRKIQRHVRELRALS